MDNKGLFEYWLKIKNISPGNAEVKSVIKSTEVKVVKNKCKPLPHKEVFTDVVYEQLQIESVYPETVLDSSSVNQEVVQAAEEHNLSLFELQSPGTTIDQQEYDSTQIPTEIIYALPKEDETLVEFHACKVSSIVAENILNIADQAHPTVNISTTTHHSENLVEDSKENVDETNKENCTNSANQDRVFANSFTLPTKYLPKKKINKLQDKQKLPSVGTSEAWWKFHLVKKEADKIKKEKKAHKKALQEEKKQLAIEKKKLQEKINAIQKRMKTEPTIEKI